MTKDNEGKLTKNTEDSEKPKEYPMATDKQEKEESGDVIEYEVIKEEDEEKRHHAAAKPHPDELKSLKNKLKKKDGEIKTLKKDREELKEKYLRALAEMENLRKRFDREKSEFFQFALSDLLRESLVVLDNFERALQAKDQTDGKSFQEGVEMIYRQFLDLLLKKGVKPIELKDKRFDPSIHQAVLTEDSEEVEEPVVAEELQRGYLLHDRLLRPAMVKVLVPKKKEER